MKEDDPQDGGLPTPKAASMSAMYHIMMRRATRLLSSEAQLQLVNPRSILNRSASVTYPPLRRSTILPMQVTTGTVVGGKVVVEGVPLVEGSVVAVLSREPDEPLSLSAQDEDELLAAVAEIERGEFVSPDELLESLRKYG